LILVDTLGLDRKELKVIKAVITRAITFLGVITMKIMMRALRYGFAGLQI